MGQQKAQYGTGGHDVPPPAAAAALSIDDKRALLRRILNERLRQTRTAPASLAQERRWLLDRLQPGRAEGHVSLALRLAGTLDAAALSRALAQVVRRHGALRTTLREQDGVPVQVVAPFAGFAPAVHDLSALAGAARQARVREMAAEHASRPFDLAAGPLMRAALLVVAPTEHVLLVCLHPVAADAASRGVLLRDLSALYNAFAAGGDDPLSPAPAQYADFAARQRETVDAAAVERQLAYWREQLRGAPAVLDLAPAAPRRADEAVRAARHPVAVSPALARRLTAVAGAADATLSDLLLAAWTALLARLAGCDDVVVGIPAPGRAPGGMDGAVGPFAGTLAVRTRLEGDPAFRDVLARVRDAARAAEAHADLPFETLEAHLRAAERGPLFPAAFALEDARGPVRFAGLAVSEVEAGDARMDCDLALALTARPGGGIDGVLAYAADRWGPDDAARLCARLGCVLQQAAADDGIPLSRLELMDAAERGRVLHQWSGTDAAAPAEPCLHRQVEARVRRAPDAPAVAEGDVVLSYAALNARANRLARYLAGAGVGPEARVALCMERGAEMVVALLAVMKTGAAYLPLDPAHPPTRLAFMARDADAAAVLTHSALRGLLDGLDGIPLLPLDTLAAALERQSAADLDVPVHGDGAAYVIYTSGSTGTPKGVAVHHGGLAAVCAWHTRALGVDAGGRGAQMVSAGFDPSALEIWPLLAAGACVDVVPDAVRADPARLRDWLVARRVTVAMVPTPLMAPLLELAWPAETALRRVLTGGDRLCARPTAGTPFTLVNGYGPTECSVTTTAGTVAAEGSGPPPIGRPVEGTRAYVLGPGMAPQPADIPGELYLGGAQVARGYLGRAALTADRFVPDPFGARPGGRLYRTGDRVRWGADGTLRFIGRVDAQAKIRGVRVEPGEVQAVLAAHPGVRAVVVTVHRPGGGDAFLAAHAVPRAGRGGEALVRELAEWARGRLPAAMVPARIQLLAALPLTPGGKVDVAALPAPAPARSGADQAAPRGAVERRVAAAWCDVLGLDAVGRDEGFFELGGHSLLLLRLQGALRARLDRDVSVADLFRHPTVASFAAALHPDALHGGAADEALSASPETAHSAAGEAVRRGATAAGRDASTSTSTSTFASTSTAPDGYGEAIAIVGMAGRFPGARDVDAFREALRTGADGITDLGEAEVLAAGADPALVRDPAYVRAAGVMEDAACFDAAFFGYTPREAEAMDPQHRVFLEALWEALEGAGYDPRAVPGRVGVFAGSSRSRYLSEHVLPRADVVAALGSFQVEIANAPDFLASRAAHRLDLRGPAVSVQTACSTGLVAVHTACRALSAGDCEVAVAGGVSVRSPQEQGYLYAPGGILSPDGRCRAFDARAAGTVRGSGVALVVLKPLAAALRDGDTIHAVIRGSAVNNDGGDRVGYTAPGVAGQSAVIRDAMARGGVEPGTVGYVEAHGTGTTLGDLVEVTALADAFGPGLPPGSCALGSAKTAIGHLDAAAGAAGLIRAVLAVKHGEVPPTLHFTTPTPGIPLAGTPFHVAAAPRPWRGEGGAPRRAGVSSFGIGGTNAHVVLEQAPAPSPSSAETGDGTPQLLPLSARTPEALARAAARLAAHLRARPGQPLADVAWTLQAGRHAFAHRRAVVARDARDAADALDAGGSAAAPAGAAGVVFLVPGTGGVYPDAGRHAYEREPAFRDAVDRCAGILRPVLGLDLRDVLYGGTLPPDEAGARLGSTRVGQVALFVLSYALARLHMARGIRPAALIGHSLGEYVAATLAGVWTLDEALRLVAARARLIDGLAAGGMLAVALPEAEVRPLLRGGLGVGAVNGPALTVVSGPPGPLAALQAALGARRVACRRLAVRHAFHSAAMQGAAAALAALVRGTAPRPPRIPFVSTVTGTWISPAQAADPAYWAEHLCAPVRFADAVATVAAGGETPVLLEMGPAQLWKLAAAHPAWGADRPAGVAALPPRAPGDDGAAALLDVTARLWAAGVEVDWTALHAGGPRRRVPLPTYPFERTVHWLPRHAAAAPAVPSAVAAPAASGASAPRARAAAAHPPSPETPAPADTPAAEDDGIHAVLLGIWAELLGLPSVGIHDDFFEAGGHSLLGMQLIGRIRACFAVQLPLRAVFDAPTIAALAVLIDREIVRELRQLGEDEAAARLTGGSPGGRVPDEGSVCHAG